MGVDVSRRRKKKSTADIVVIVMMMLMMMVGRVGHDHILSNLTYLTWGTSVPRRSGT